VHLLFTCFASADSDVDVVDTLNFRRRLTALLDSGIHHGLEKLVPLWKSLAKWLTAQRAKGRRLRELQLPEVGHLTIIGYSVRLAFPTYRDQARLIELIREFQTDAEPPVRGVIRAVSRDLHRFSARFQAEVSEFRRKYTVGDRDPYESAFWAAVRHAATVARLNREREQKIPRLGLAMEPDPSRAGSFTVIAVAEGTIPGEHDLEFHPLARRTERFAYAVTSKGMSIDPHQGIVNLLLSDGPRGRVLGEASRSVMHIVAHGVLLFERLEGGTYLLRSNRPDAPDVAVLVKEHLSHDLLTACRSAGKEVEERPALYRGWREIRVRGSILNRARFEGFASLRNIPCLQDVLRSKRPRLVGGVRVDNAWLSCPPRLPNIVAEADSVSVIGWDESRAPMDGFTLREVVNEANLWRFPPLLPDSRLEGRVKVVARRADREVTTTAAFVSSVLGGDYLGPTDPADWLTEVALAHVATYKEQDDPVGQGANDQTDDATHVGGLLGATRQEQGDHGPSVVLGSQELSRIENAVEIFAGVSLQRRGLSEREFLDVLRDVFGLRGRLLYEIGRAWVEGGLFDRLIYRRWRSVFYFAHRPRLVVHPDGNGFRCVLDGLAPSVVRQRLIRAAADFGAARKDAFLRNPWAPAPLAFFAPSLVVAQDIAAQAELAPVQMLVIPDPLVSAVADAASTMEARPPNYDLIGEIDAATGRLVRDFKRRDDDVRVEWYGRPDLPDYFVVHRPGHVPFLTRSRTWALLTAVSFRGVPFAPSGETTVHRSFGHAAHLPLPAARFASIVGRCVCGPHPDHPGDYFYDVGSTVLRALVLGRLCGAEEEVDREECANVRLEWLVATLLEDRRFRRVVAPLRKQLQESSRRTVHGAARVLIPRLPAAFRARLVRMIGSKATTE
jgi:hypothetical protein